MKCAVIILTFLHISSGLDGSDDEDVVTARGKRTLFYQKNTPPVSTQPRFDYNLYPKYYPLLNIQPYNDPEVIVESRSNPLHVLEPPRVISTDQFETSKASVNLVPGYVNANEYDAVRYLPGDVLAVLSELVKPLMMNNYRQMRGKKPAHNDGIYLRHGMNNVPEYHRSQIIDQIIPPVGIINTEPPVIKIKKVKKTKTNVKKAKLQTEKKPVKVNTTNQTIVSNTTSDVTDSDSGPSTTTIKYNDPTTTDLESTTESTYATLSLIEDKSDEDLQEVNADVSDSDNVTKESELNATNQTLSINDTSNESHPDENVNDDMNDESISNEAGDQKDDVLKHTNQLMEAVKSEVAKQLELIVELLGANKLTNIDTEQEKTENEKEIIKNSKKNDTGAVTRDKDGEKCCQKKEKAKSIFTNFEGNEHFANFFLFYPNRDIFNMQEIDEPTEKSTKLSNKKFKATTDKTKAIIDTGDVNNQKRDEESVKKSSDVETGNLKVSVNKRNGKEDSENKDAKPDSEEPDTALSLEADVTKSSEVDSSEDTSVTAAIDDEESDSSDSDDGNDSVSDVNDSTIVKRSLLDVLR